MGSWSTPCAAVDGCEPRRDEAPQATQSIGDGFSASRRTAAITSGSAAAMAADGAGFRAILEHYYPNTVLANTSAPNRDRQEAAFSTGASSTPRR